MMCLDKTRDHAAFFGSTSNRDAKKALSGEYELSEPVSKVFRTRHEFNKS